MMNKQEFTKLAKQILHPYAGSMRPRAVYPEREWLVGLLVSVIIFLACSVWSAQTYLKYRNLTVGGEGEEVETVIYRKSQVDAALAEFAKREVELDLLLGHSISEVREEGATVAATSSEDGSIPLPAGQETSTTTETLGSTPIESESSASTGETFSEEEVLTEEVTPEI